jgi:hydroxymethylpyrimidine pyrophosphatase-like HAD family hydrolase
MVIAVDFDGTIVEHAYPKIGKPIPFAIDVLKKLQQEEHHILILWTVREGKLLQEALDYCKKKGLTFYAANENYPEEGTSETPRKLSADLFIDDKNIGGLFDWGVIYKMIKYGVTDSRDIDDYILDESRPPRKRNLFFRLGEAWDMAHRY